MDDHFDTSFRLADRLHDIRLPDGVPAWPPAPGWWLLGFLGLFVIAGLALLWHRRSLVRKAALRKLDELESDYHATGNAVAFAAGLSTLLRRLAIALDGRRTVAGLTGEAWLAYLDRRGGTDDFTRGNGRVLITLPYGGPGFGEAGTLGGLVRRWIGGNT